MSRNPMLTDEQIIALAMTLSRNLMAAHVMAMLMQQASVFGPAGIKSLSDFRTFIALDPATTTTHRDAAAIISGMVNWLQLALAGNPDGPTQSVFVTK